MIYVRYFKAPNTILYVLPIRNIYSVPKKCGYKTQCSEGYKRQLYFKFTFPLMILTNDL